MPLTSEKKKQIAAGVLGCLALITIIYTLFFSDDSSSSKSATAKSGKTATKVIPGINAPVNSAATENATQQAKVTLVSQPLDLGGLGSSTSPVIERNIFVYPPPPPPPTPKPTPTPTVVPPPPITLGGLNPSSVIARTTEFSLTVFGAKIPTDAQVFINGANFPTTVLNESQLKVTVPATVIANPGAAQVEVKSASDPVKMYSNRVTLNITAPPVPQYRYLGLIVKNGVSTAFIRDEAEVDLQAVKKGQRLGSRWQVTNITPNEIEILDITINIKHRIPFTGEGG